MNYMQLNRAIVEAIDSVAWYNGLSETIENWKILKPEHGAIRPPYNYGADSDVDAIQLQMVWMVCVILYGDYGTSPRYGWITDVDGFHSFIDSVTKTYKFERENGNVQTPNR